MTAETNEPQKTNEEKEPCDISNNFTALLNREEELSNGSNKELVEQLLERCELKRFSEIYITTVAKNDGIYSQKKLFNFNNVFTAEKVKYDVSAIPDLLFVSLIDPKPLKHELNYQKLQSSNLPVKKIREKEPSGKEFYIINKNGLKKMLLLYRKRRIFGPILDISTILSEFEMTQEQRPTLIQMIRELIEEKKIYADFLIEQNQDGTDGKLIFKNKLSDPEQRKRLIMILLLTGLLFLFLFIYQQLISTFFGQ